MNTGYPDLSIPKPKTTARPIISSNYTLKVGAGGTLVEHKENENESSRFRVRDDFGPTLEFQNSSNFHDNRRNITSGVDGITLNYLPDYMWLSHAHTQVGESGIIETGIQKTDLRLARQIVRKRVLFVARAHIH
ncbi:hypothetical protein ACTXT7_002704 [Hymenolepis weldensis]